MTTDLRAYAPRLVLSWAKDSPDARHRSVSGSMVFCDVSGFTALSERLAAKGKVGAEELTEVLNAVFTNLLATAAEYGGSMLKYGGDAVLVFFWGDDHERRACRAAVSMRAALRATATPIRLRMSVGIHSGDFDFFLVGQSHRELVVTGPAATVTCGAESEASAGEIVVSAGTASVLPRGCVDERRRLRRAPTVRAQPIEPQPDEPAQLFVPTALREHLVTGTHDPSHRHVAVGFVQFSGVDELLRVQGADAVADRLDQLTATAQHEFDEHGVTFLATDINGDGGKIIAVAGAPTSYGDNEERAVRALTSLLAKFEGLSLRMGVHRGAVFTGDIGPQFRRTYTALGDVVNTAARVMASAEPGQLRATTDVLERTDTLFATEQQPAFMAKGKKQPLTTFSVGAPLGRREERHGRLPLFGRQDELARLLAAVERAEDGHGSLVEVVGEGGIGKTRLLHELDAAEPGARAVAASCQQYEITTPYFAARQLLSRVFQLRDRPRPQDLRATVAAVAPDLLPWLPLVALPLDVRVPQTPEVSGLDERFVKERMQQVVTELVTRACEGPVRWVVEDAQWIDEASRELLGAVFARVAERPWSVFLSRRPEDHPIFAGIASEMIVLRPLPEADAIGLARAAAPHGLLPPEAELLARRASGHPLFVRELAQAFRGEQELDELPDSIDAVITARIDALAPPERAALRVAAVLGATFTVGMLRQLAPEADLRTLRAFIDVQGDTASFRQALFQKTAYDALPFRQRRVLHGAAVRLLGTEDGAANDEVLSLHAYEGQLFEDAWKYSVRAAENATKRLANAEAIVLYRRALRAARSLPDLPAEKHADAWTLLGRLLVRAGRLREAKDAYPQARRLVGERPRLLLNEGEVRAELGLPTQAMRWFRRGLRCAETDKWRIPLLGAMAKLRLSQGDVAVGMAMAREAVALAEGDPPDVDAGHVAGAWSILAGGALINADANAAEYNQRALALYRDAEDKIGEGTVLSNLGTLAYAEGRIDDALAFYNESRDALHAAGASVFAAVTANNIGEVLGEVGRLDDAVAVLEDALATLRVADSWYAAYPLRNLAGIAAQRGDAVAATHYRDAIEQFRNAGVEKEAQDTEALLDQLELAPQA
ncbi:MAG TPA: adenylate/guanylate cyclase domain-containing protein [Acidimicrobiales bacterium]|nr:adenylate/guanylate cyclase domain-containing protein [Acidimicrobiales bacterium]